jgi:hypothetical protein
MALSTPSPSPSPPQVQDGVFTTHALGGSLLSPQARDGSQRLRPRPSQCPRLRPRPKHPLFPSLVPLFTLRSPLVRPPRRSPRSVPSNALPQRLKISTLRPSITPQMCSLNMLQTRLRAGPSTSSNACRRRTLDGPQTSTQASPKRAFNAT